MQDTKNLKRKLKEYKKILDNPSSQGRGMMKFLFDVEWLRDQIRDIEERIESRRRNKKNNEKQFKKAN